MMEQRRYKTLSWRRMKSTGWLVGIFYETKDDWVWLTWITKVLFSWIINTWRLTHVINIKFQMGNMRKGNHHGVSFIGLLFEVISSGTTSSKYIKNMFREILVIITSLLGFFPTVSMVKHKVKYYYSKEKNKRKLNITRWNRHISCVSPHE